MTEKKVSATPEQSRDSISTVLCHWIRFNNPSEQGGDTVEIESRDCQNMRGSTVKSEQFQPFFQRKLFYKWVALCKDAVRAACGVWKASWSSSTKTPTSWYVAFLVCFYSLNEPKASRLQNDIFDSKPRHAVVLCSISPWYSSKYKSYNNTRNVSTF